MIIRLLPVLAGALMLSACIMPSEPIACADIDWYATGERDGAEGRALRRLDRHLDRCGDADVVAYRAGRQQGLRGYCLPENGYSIGKSGREYLGVCPTALADDFLREYERGRYEGGPNVGLSVGIGSGGHVGWGVGIGFPVGHDRRRYGR